MTNGGGSHGTPALGNLPLVHRGDDDCGRPGDSETLTISKKDTGSTGLFDYLSVLKGQGSKVKDVVLIDGMPNYVMVHEGGK